jgi:dihydrofolate reductase
MAKNRVIGIENRLPWRLPGDMQRFRALTMGHHILAGRKTYESIGKPLPGRSMVVITRSGDFTAPGCIVVNSVAEAIAACRGDAEIFIIGGEQLYRQTLDVADRIYLTEVQAEFTGDACFPELDPTLWRETERTRFPADDGNPCPYDFVVYDKIGKVPGYEPAGQLDA